MYCCLYCLKRKKLPKIICKFLFIILVDHTRVLLKDVDTSVAGADYINANHIRVIKFFSQID